MAISERIPDCKCSICRLFHAEEQLADQKRVFEAYAAESKATIDARDAENKNLHAMIAQDDFDRMEWSYNKMQVEALREMVDARDREIAELKVALHDIAGGTYSHSACVRGRELLDRLSKSS
jgi:hypothetical protein